MGADETPIEALFQEAIRIAKEYKSVSLQKRAEEPTQSTIAKKRVCQEDVDSDCLFDERLQRAVSRFGWGTSSVIKQTLEMQIEDTSATRYPLKWAC
jgi:hypothetical protein